MPAGRAVRALVLRYLTTSRKGRSRSERSEKVQQGHEEIVYYAHEQSKGLKPGFSRPVDDDFENKPDEVEQMQTEVRPPVTVENVNEFR